MIIHVSVQVVEIVGYGVSCVVVQGALGRSRGLRIEEVLLEASGDGLGVEVEESGYRR